jgi:non-heme chloroperoxidase
MGTSVPFITVDAENTTDIDLYYEDLGSGQPVVLVHGYPLHGHAWERQIPVLLAAGFRVITYNRRGFGQSSHPTFGYDFDTFAADLNLLIEVLDIRDIVLAGFSMGTGEVGRYLGTYGPGRVDKAVFIACVGPFLLKTADNPDGLDSKHIDAALSAVVKDRWAYFRTYYTNVFNTDDFGARRVNAELIEMSWTAACSECAYASVAAAITWTTDFRNDIDKIAGYDVEMMIVHGTRDRILPIDSTSRRMHRLLPQAHYIEIVDAPHGLLWTYADDINHELLAFMGRPDGSTR